MSSLLNDISILHDKNQICVTDRGKSVCNDKAGSSPHRPNTISPIIVYATLNVAGAIISEATLSFLGLGISQPTASWGNILRAGKDCLNTAPHIATISGIFILVTVLGFNLLGDGVRDVLDPKMKK